MKQFFEVVGLTDMAPTGSKPSILITDGLDTKVWVRKIEHPATMGDLITHALALGYKLSFNGGGYQQIMMSIEKEGRTSQQTFPDDHFSADYCRKVFDYMVTNAITLTPKT